MRVSVGKCTCALRKGFSLEPVGLNRSKERSDSAKPFKDDEDFAYKCEERAPKRVTYCCM